MIRTTPFCDLIVSFSRRNNSIVCIHDTSEGIVFNTALDHDKGCCGRSLFVSIRHPIARACRPGRLRTIQVYIQTSPSRPFAMAAPAASEAEKLGRYQRYYPYENSSPVEYIRLWLNVITGLAERPGAPVGIDEDFLVVQGATSYRAFIDGDWWRYWSSSLPAMMRE